MGRARKYDRDDVLDRAVDLFWRQGYKASSMTDIVRATGMNTASMYKEFGDKDGLFEEALEYYRHHVIGPRIRTLTNNPNIDGVAAFLQNVVDGAASPEYKGCLMMNHLAQTHSISAQAARTIDDFCAAMEALLEAALRNAQARGELPAGKDPAEIASFIMCCVHGLVLYGRHPEKKKEIPKLYDMVLEVLSA